MTGRHHRARGYTGQSSPISFGMIFVGRACPFLQSSRTGRLVIRGPRNNVSLEEDRNNSIACQWLGGEAISAMAVSICRLGGVTAAWQKP